MLTGSVLDALKIPGCSAEIPVWMSASPLWVTLPGASPRVAFGWLAWMLLAALAAPGLTALLGPAGTVGLVLVAGWMLGHRHLVPSACLRRYHLDDAEVTALGPGRMVRRLPWSEIGVIAQDRRALRVETRATWLALPLDSLVSSAGWKAVLTRVVAALADELWSLIEDGEPIRLEPRADPSIDALVWWAYAPVALTCALSAGFSGACLAIGLAAAERALALARRRSGVVTLDRQGVTVRRRGRRVVVPWGKAEVSRVPHGLVIAMPGATAAFVANRLPNFSAVAPVIETKAQLGPHSAPVHFRVRVAGGTLAVVGEVEPAA
jgi:hypothetical protein